MGTDELKCFGVKCWLPQLHDFILQPLYLISLSRWKAAVTTSHYANLIGFKYSASLGAFWWNGQLPIMPQTESISQRHHQRNTAQLQILHKDSLFDMFLVELYLASESTKSSSHSNPFSRHCPTSRIASHH